MSIFSGVLQSLLGGVAGGANSFGDTLKEKEYFKRKVENDIATELRKSEADKIKATRDLAHSIALKRVDQGYNPSFSFGEHMVDEVPTSAQKTQPSFSLNTDTPISTAGSFGDALVASAPTAAPTSGPVFNPNNMVTSTSDLYDLNKLGRFMSGAKFERTPEASMKDQLLFGKYGLDKSKLDETVRHNRAIEELGNSRAMRATSNVAQRKLDGHILPASQAAMLGEGANVPALLDNLNKTLSANENIGGPFSGRIQGNNPYATDTQKVQAEINAVRQVVGKFLEGGVLRKEDEVKYEKMIPNINDTPEVRVQKIEIVKNMIQQQFNSKLDSFGRSGYNVSNYQPLGQTKPSGQSQAGVQQLDAALYKIKVSRAARANRTGGLNNGN